MINFLKIKDEIYKEIKDLKQKDDEHEKKRVKQSMKQT